MTDDEVRRRVAAGTTTRPEQLRVLYNDGKCVLVKHPGARVQGEWIPAWVVLYNTENVGTSGEKWPWRDVWDCDRSKNGPLTRKRLLTLVKKLGLAPEHIRAGAQA